MRYLHIIVLLYSCIVTWICKGRLNIILVRALSINTLLYLCVYIGRFIDILRYLHIIRIFFLVFGLFEFLSMCKGRLKVILVRALSKWCCLCIHKRWALLTEPVPVEQQLSDLLKDFFLTQNLNGKKVWSDAGWHLRLMFNFDMEYSSE